MAGENGGRWMRSRGIGNGRSVSAGGGGGGVDEEDAGMRLATMLVVL